MACCYFMIILVIGKLVHYVSLSALTKQTILTLCLSQNTRTNFHEEEVGGGGKKGSHGGRLLFTKMRDWRSCAI